MPAAMARVRQSVWRITSKVLHNSNVSYCVVARPISASMRRLLLSTSIFHICSRWITEAVPTLLLFALCNEPFSSVPVGVRRNIDAAI
jgi:hypothetical protein